MPQVRVRGTGTIAWILLVLTSMVLIGYGVWHAGWHIWLPAPVEQEEVRIGNRYIFAGCALSLATAVWSVKDTPWYRSFSFRWQPPAIQVPESLVNVTAEVNDHLVSGQDMKLLKGEHCFLGGPACLLCAFFCPVFLCPPCWP